MVYLSVWSRVHGEGNHVPRRRVNTWTGFQTSAALQRRRCLHLTDMEADAVCGAAIITSMYIYTQSSARSAGCGLHILNLLPDVYLLESLLGGRAAHQELVWRFSAEHHGAGWTNCFNQRPFGCNKYIKMIVCRLSLYENTRTLFQIACQDGPSEGYIEGFFFYLSLFVSIVTAVLC